jgi:hypothetical protein
MATERGAESPPGSPAPGSQRPVAVEALVGIRLRKDAAPCPPRTRIRQRLPRVARSRSVVGIRSSFDSCCVSRWPFRPLPSVGGNLRDQVPATRLRPVGRWVLISSARNQTIPFNRTPGSFIETDPIREQRGPLSSSAGIRVVIFERDGEFIADRSR